MRLDHPHPTSRYRGDALNGDGRMPGIVKAEIYFDGEYYCARTLNIDVFTQGRTIDEVVENL